MAKTGTGEEHGDGLDGWTSLAVATESPPHDREPLVELVGQTRADYLQIFTNFNFQYVKGYSPTTAKIALQPGAAQYWSFMTQCHTMYNCKVRARSGITVIVQQEDDLLSSSGDDIIENIYPLGDAAISVSNSTDYDSTAAGYECPLDTHVLITTSDGVEYCMPIAVACEPPTGGPGVALLTIEQREMAGYSPTTTDSATTGEGTGGGGSTESADGGGGMGASGKVSDDPPTGGAGTGGGIVKSDAPFETGGGLPKGGGYI